MEDVDVTQNIAPTAGIAEQDMSFPFVMPDQDAAQETTDDGAQD